jgi:hypothetical protein
MFLLTNLFLLLVLEIQASQSNPNQFYFFNYNFSFLRSLLYDIIWYDFLCHPIYFFFNWVK